ncbi:MAG: tetratricopeptide repeat protein [Alphaproteobacteria bacterium]|nr:MAG: tetratricopeptide repeat protein [Alphaproteobacteria bacterium]
MTMRFSGRSSGRSSGWLRLVLAGLVLLGLAACESAEERVAAHLAQGRALVAAGQDAKARLEFANALRIDADNVAAHLELARLYERTGELRPMLGHLNRLVELDPANPWVRGRLALISLAAGDPDTALAHAEAAVAAAPQDAGALAARAVVRFAMGRTEAALADAQAAVAVEPGQPLAGHVIVRARMVAGDPEGALAELDGFLARHPDDVELNALRLALLAQLQREEELGAQLVRMTELTPDAPDYWALLVQWHLRRGDFAGAFDRLAARIARPTPAPLGTQLAQIAGQLADQLAARDGPEAARAALARLAEAAESPALYARLLAAFDHAHGRTAEAVAALEAMIAGPDAAAAAEARLMLARIRLSADDRAGALKLVEAVLEADAKNTEALAIRAALALEEGRIEAAQNDLRVALTESPENPALLTLMARSHVLAGNRTLADQALAGAMQAANYAPGETLRYAAFLVEDGRAAAAETVLTEAARRHPAARELLLRLAELRLQLGKAAEAAEVADQLARLDGDDQLADRIRAAALYGQKRYDESLAILERLAADPAERDRALAALVSAHVAAGRRDRAVALLDQILQENPDHPQALLLSAGLAEEAGDIATARRRLEHLRAAAPDDPRGHLALIALERRQGRIDAARAVLDAALAILPDDPDLNMVRAGLAEEAGDIETAIAGYEKVIAARPAALVALNNYVSLVTDHHPNDAERLARLRVMAAPLRISRIPHFRDTYGWLLHLSGDDAGALELLVPAAEELPDNPWVRYHLGMVLARSGQAEAARGNLEAALRLAGDGAFPPAGRIRETLAGLGG